MHCYEHHRSECLHFNQYDFKVKRGSVRFSAQTIVFAPVKNILQMHYFPTLAVVVLN